MYNKFSNNQTIEALLSNTVIPSMVPVKQFFPSADARSADGIISDAFTRPQLRQRISPGMKVAVTAGSRGIANIDKILKAAVDFVKNCGAFPFLVPAMGSHGGATAEGQKSLLAGYGITEKTMGCPICSSMETVKLCELEEGTPVYIDRMAAEADGIIVINRIKVHTNFHGTCESGLIKMMAIGLGKQYGARQVHAGDPKMMGKRVEKFGLAVLHHTNILFGIAIVEDGYEKTAHIEALLPEEIERREPELLKKAGK